MNKLENIIKLRIGYYNSMLDVLSKDENKTSKYVYVGNYFKSRENGIRASFRGLS